MISPEARNAIQMPVTDAFCGCDFEPPRGPAKANAADNPAAGRDGDLGGRVRPVGEDRDRFGRDVAVRRAPTHSPLDRETDKLSKVALGESHDGND